MKFVKNHFVKRTFILFCCTTLILSNVFISHSITVYAIEYDDLLWDGVQVALSAAGIYFSGGTLTPALIIPFVERVAGTGFDVHDYITQNEDGTTTISQDFVNLVLSAYKEYTTQNFDGSIKQDEESMYYVYGGAENHLYSSGTEWTIINNDFTYAYPVAFLMFNDTDQFAYSYWGKSLFEAYQGVYGVGYCVFAYNGNPDSSNGGIFLVDDYPSLFGMDTSDPLTYIYLNGNASTPKSNCLSSLTSTRGGHEPLNNGMKKEYYVTVSTDGIPVYTSFDMMRDDFYNGNYTHAENYGGNLGQTSSYTGKYSGGDINVTTEKLNGIQDKLDEINETDKSIDDKLKDLLDWLGIGDGTGGGSSGSWYDKVLDYLDKILKQLKSIKHWTIVDTVIDGVDALADWLDLIHDILSDVDDGAESAIATLSSALDDSLGLMKKKFPFSIPWDILFFVTVLSAEPEVPQFSIPFDFEISALDLEFHYDMELDFTQFQWLSDLSRLMLSMTYAVGLMKMTFDVSNINKEG